MPRIAAAAVSTIGRKRRTLACTTASQPGRPRAISTSIWSIRMTAFLTIIPIKANTPKRATNPSGFPDSSSAGTTPISPRGATLMTRNSRLKL